ncbi:hypothetical protein [Persicitalea jodogahamensis]|uniref:Outer membrane lipoprotein-sorting protein n=1 Tax=Persicitalea jodogahamensis TaxID=402147 RepID=A0A8J3D2R6_9BACT|nr:hypothetical protein [Persicitalea jodogahamensis]GHB62584.1 hypothetical protein GCM10007390_15520 [Persicitalea jodogahamensis]
MKHKAILGLLLGLGLGLTSFAQELTTADAVVEKYLTAVGGKDKIRSMQDMTVTATTDIQGRTMETETKLKIPNKFKQTSYMMGNEAGGSTYDGTTLSRSMRGQTTTKQGQEAYQEFILNHPFPEIFYDSLKVEKKLIGTEKVDGKDAYDVEFASNGNTWHDFFDKESGLKVKRTTTTESPRGKMAAEFTYGDYKAVNGIMFPFTSSRKFGQFEMSSETQSIKLNKGIDDKQFKIK